MVGNPFLNNTPSSSPVKKHDDSSRKGIKKPTSYSSSSSQLSSPVRKTRPSSSVVYNDRFMPSRTGLDMNTMVSLSSATQLPQEPSFNSKDQVELQKARQAHETFDAVLKNELFGEKIIKNVIGSATSIDRIQSTRNLVHTNSASVYNSTCNDYEEVDTDVDDEPREPPRTPSSERRRDSHTTSIPATPNRLFGSHLEENYKSSLTLARGASLLTYQEKNLTRPSTASILQSQLYDFESPVRPESKQLLLSPGKKFRQIAKVPYRVLDAPFLADDFYYDLVEWSSTNMLAVALGNSMFLTESSNGGVVHLCETENNYTSLSWVGAGTHLAVGQNNGIVEIYDVTKKICIKTLSGHTDRVACLSWNNHVLSSGSRDRSILHRDVRTPNPYFEKIETHTQEVCGLKWNVDDNKLASGGNDNVVCVYDGVSNTPTMKMTEHTAAVKALAWSPHKRGVLATGGGTADKKMKIWNVNLSTKLNEVDTGSQICNMIWSKNTDEIVTSHGYSKYNLTLWNYPTLDPVAILKGHTFRVLHLSLSADGTTVVSGAGDETLRFWKLFDKLKQKNEPESLIFNAFNQIR